MSAAERNQIMDGMKPDPSAVAGAFQTQKGGPVHNAASAKNTPPPTMPKSDPNREVSMDEGLDAMHQPPPIDQLRQGLGDYVQRADAHSLQTGNPEDAAGFLPRATKSTLDYADAAASPGNAGVIAANLNPVTGIPMDAYLAAKGAYNLYDKGGAVKDYVTTGQANPNDLETALSGGAGLAGGAAGMGVMGNVARRAMYDPKTGAEIPKPIRSSIKRTLFPEPSEQVARRAQEQLGQETNDAKNLQDPFIAKESKAQPINTGPTADVHAATRRALRKPPGATAPDPFSGATSSSNPPAAPTPKLAASSSPTVSSSPQTMPQVPGISAQAGRGEIAPPVTGERGTVPQKPDPNTVLQLPVPKDPIPGVPNNMGNTPREVLFDAADRGVSGAGPQLQSLGQRVLYRSSEFEPNPPKSVTTFPSSPEATLPPPTLPAIPSEGAPPPAPTGTQGPEIPLTGPAVAPNSFRTGTRPLLLPPKPPQQ